MEGRPRLTVSVVKVECKERAAMSGLAIVGAQWGDEGKGKIVDYLAAEASVVVRYAGGNNAGHTVVVDDKTVRLHLVPSGDRKSTRLNSSHVRISYAVFC